MVLGRRDTGLRVAGETARWRNGESAQNPVSLARMANEQTDYRMSKRDKNTEAVPIGQVIESMLQKQRKTTMGLTRVWPVWEAAVGDLIAANARPAAFKGRILLVHVSSSPWLHQLRFLKQEIIAKVNNALGESIVADINFKIGPLE